MAPTKKTSPASRRGPAARGNRRREVTLIVENSHVSGRNIVRGIARYNREQMARWLINHEWRNTDVFYPAWLDDWQGDGFIARIESKRILRKIKSFGVPVVDVLGTNRDPEIPLVHVDDGAIAAMAAKHLLDRGFRYFAYVGFAWPSWALRRRDALVRAVQAEGYPCEVHAWPAGADMSWSWGEEQDTVARWLRSLPKPVGIMLCSDSLSPMMLEACRRSGLAVPDEIAVIGVDNDELMCETSEPPLSSVVPDDQGVGYEAAHLLDRLMQGETWDGEHVYLQPKGVVTRLSSDVLAIEDQVVAAAVGFIREHALEDLTVDDVVQTVPVCRTLLQRRFRKAIGRSLHDEILRVRLEHARFLLEESDMPLWQVAEKSGFKHQEYMGVVFKKHLGQTPLQFRKGSRRDT